jgi:hypothetical protein
VPQWRVGKHRAQPELVSGVGARLALDELDREARFHAVRRVDHLTSFVEAVPARDRLCSQSERSTRDHEMKATRSATLSGLLLLASAPSCGCRLPPVRLPPPEVMRDQPTGRGDQSEYAAESGVRSRVPLECASIPVDME